MNLSVAMLHTCGDELASANSVYNASDAVMM